MDSEINLTLRITHERNLPKDAQGIAELAGALLTAVLVDPLVGQAAEVARIERLDPPLLRDHRAVGGGDGRRLPDDEGAPHLEGGEEARVRLPVEHPVGCST